MACSEPHAGLRQVARGARIYETRLLRWDIPDFRRLINYIAMDLSQESTHGCVRNNIMMTVKRMRLHVLLDCTTGEAGSAIP